MKRKFPLLCIALLVTGSGVGLAQRPHGDPVHAHLFSPEELMQHRAEIGLTDQQLEKIRTRVEGAGPRVQQHQAGLQDAMDKLMQLLAADEVNEEAALKQLDAIHEIEGKVKRAHMRIMIQIRNELTAEQRQIAAKLKPRQVATNSVQNPQPDEGFDQRMKSKIARIKEEVQRLAHAGQPPLDVVELMQQVPALMQQGQVTEAEALLDRALKLLDLTGR